MTVQGTQRSHIPWQIHLLSGFCSVFRDSGWRLGKIAWQESMSLICPSYKKTVSSSLSPPRWNREVISVWDLGIEIQLNLYFPRSKEKKHSHPHFLIWLVLFQARDLHLLGKVSEAKLGHTKFHFNPLHRTVRLICSCLCSQPATSP